MTLEALAGSELILMEKNAPYNRKFESLLAQHNVACEPFLRLPSASAARELLLDGPFVSLLPWYTVRAIDKKQVPQSVALGHFLIRDAVREDYSNA